MADLGNRIEQDVMELKGLLSKDSLAFEEIVDRTNWSEEKTRIYLNSLLNKKEISCDDKGCHYVE